MTETTEIFFTEDDENRCRTWTTMKFDQRSPQQKRVRFGVNLQCSQEAGHEGKHQATLKPQDGPEAQVEW